ncbi:MAG TPA: hypothetical protein VFB88_06960 [Xanthobacteraceae bacterium]|nr:hypothetical protein [Xanthobacteraceae bacterium]
MAKTISAFDVAQELCAAGFAVDQAVPLAGVILETGRAVRELRHKGFTQQQVDAILSNVTKTVFADP